MFSIRWKFLTILLGFSVTPLLVFFVLNYRASLQLGEDLNEVARGLMATTAGKELQEAAENYARNLARELRGIEAGLRRYARDVADEPSKVETRLAAVPPIARVSGQPSIDFGPVAGRLRVIREGALSTAHSWSPGQTAQPFPGDAPQSSSASPPPVELTIEIPVARPDGSAAGAVAFDIDLLDLIERTRPVSQWSEFVTSLLVSTGADGRADVLAIRSVQDGFGDWQQATSDLRAEGARRLAAADLGSELLKWPQGYGTLVLDSVPWVWAYAVAPRGLAVVNLLPQRETVYRLTQTRGRLSRLYTTDTLAVAAVVLLVLTLLATVRSKKMIRPFLKMVTAFQRLSQGDFSTRLSTSASDERRMVAEAFNTMAVQLEDRMRIRQGLEVAREIQQAFLPDTGVTLPGIEVAARIRYCEETGGDYIDLIPRGDRLGVVVSDITGHGIGAALLMATARALIRARYGEPGGPASLMNSVNRNLAADIGDSGRFLTLFFLEIDSAARTLQWIRAGHDPAWLFARDGAVRLLDGPGMALGVDEAHEFEAGPRLSLRPGDLVLIGTDGIWETRGPSGDVFGKERVERVVVEHRHLGAADICAAVLQAVDDFRAGGHQEDDVSVVAVKGRDVSLS